jgi:hypothetical protein
VRSWSGCTESGVARCRARDAVRFKNVPVPVDAKLPGFRVYDLRHTYASLLLAAGAPITYVEPEAGRLEGGIRELLENAGEPSGTRTQDPLIKSQVL